METNSARKGKGREDYDDGMKSSSLLLIERLNNQTGPGRRQCFKTALKRGKGSIIFEAKIRSKATKTVEKGDSLYSGPQKSEIPSFEPRNYSNLQIFHDIY